MSFKFLNRLRTAFKRSTLGFRLMLSYALLFTGSTLLLFLLAYVLLVSFMRQKDHDFLQAELHEYAAAYASGGLNLVEWEVESRAGYGRHTPILVRLADAQNRTLYLHTPPGVDADELEWLEQRLPEVSGEWFYGSLGEDDEDEDEAFEVGWRRLPEGALLQVGMSTEGRGELLESFRRVFATVALPILFLGLIGGALLSYRALRPLRHLVGTLQAITRTGEINERVPTPQARGEFTELVRLFNGMLDRIQALLLGMRRTLDDVAHDLRTPMTRLRGTAELALQRERDPEAWREALSDSLEASEAILTMLGTLMDVSEAEAGTIRLYPEALRVRDLIADVADLYGFVAEEKGITLAWSAPEELHLLGDRSRMHQVLANLLDNAVKYTPPGGRVEVGAHQDGPEVVIQVRDSGIGISAEELPRIWDRLYRGDQSRSERGLGLGLSLVKAIVEAHGGHVEAVGSPGEGSTFAVRLPGRLRPMET